MKTLVKDYIFDKTNKRVIFTGITPDSLEEILLITNVSTGDIIYNFADKLRGGTLAGNVLTLIFDTSKMKDDDKLQIFIESDDYNQSLIRILASMGRSVNYARDSGDRLRTIVDSGSLSIYNRNSSAQINGSYEQFYSAGSWSAVDAREQLAEQNKSAVMTRMQRWTRS
ncbi:hypothetical protein ABWK22_02550 [Gottfriedia acidiceleris]|uniref:hypothetical protein n=1 Tax=Gottfriedia acidiceleris TaxID=371036 RepID=UPI003392627A